MYLNIISDTMTQLQRNKTYAMAKGLGTRFFPSGCSGAFLTMCLIVFDEIIRFLPKNIICTLTV
jgi:hypothetical protein